MNDTPQLPLFTIAPNDPEKAIEYGYCQCGCGELAPIATKTVPKNGWIKGEPKRFINHHNKRAKWLPDPPNPSGLCMCGCGKKTKIAKSTVVKEGRLKGHPRRYLLGHSRPLNPERNSAEDFWAKIQIGPPDECWEWQGGTNSEGYGIFGFHGKAWMAHRLAWTFTFGEIVDDLYILHKCDRPPCCNPAHLFLGTHSDNTADMVAKNRQARLHGELSPAAKLTNEQVLQIREMARQRTMKQAEIAKLFHIGVNQVEKIVARLVWKHI